MVGNSILVEVVSANFLVSVGLAHLTLPCLANPLEGFGDVSVGENLAQFAQGNLTILDL